MLLATLILLVGAFVLLSCCFGFRRAFLIMATVQLLLVPVSIVSAGIDSFDKLVSYDAEWMITLIPAVLSGILVFVIGVVLVVKARHLRTPLLKLNLAIVAGGISAFSPFIVLLVKYLAS